MRRKRFPLTAFWLALALTASGCATTGTGGPKAAGGSAAKADKPAAAIEGTRVVATGAAPSYPEDPLARRLPAKVMRIWIAPWEDSRGDLHAPGYPYGWPSLMPRDPFPDDVLKARRLGRVAVRAADGPSLAPCHPARARALVRRGRAQLIRRDPPLIRLQISGEET